MVRSFFKSGFVYTIGNVLTKGMSVILLPIYTRFISPEDYGILDIIMVFGSLVSTVIPLSITNAVGRFYPDTRSSLGKKIIASTGLLYTFFIFLFFLIISLLFEKTFFYIIFDEFNDYNQSLYCLGMISLSLSGIYYYTQNQLKWMILSNKYILSSIYNSFTSAIVSILLLFYGFKLESIFIGLIIGNIIGIVFSIYYAKECYSFIFSTRKFKEMISFSYPYVISSLAMLSFLYVDRIAIKHFLGFDDLGLYGVAYRISMMSTIVMLGFQSALTPLVYKHYKELNTPNNISLIFTVFFNFAVIVLCFSILFSSELIMIFSNNEYYTVGSLIPFIVVSNFLSNMYIFAPGLSIEKKSKIKALIIIFVAILNIILNLVFIPLIELYGAVIATFISAFVFFYLYIKLGNKYYKIAYYWKNKIICLLFIVIISYIFLLFFNTSSFFIILLKIVLLTLLSISCFYFTGLFKSIDIISKIKKLRKDKFGR